MIGVVLAGGASSRFSGQPKGLVPLAGKPLASHVSQVLAGFCDQVMIEAATGVGYERLGLPLCPSLPAYAGKGPLAGIAAGLAAFDGDELVAFAPCDMPLLKVEVYEVLRASCLDAAGAYARTSAGAEPLVCILRAKVLPGIVDALRLAELPRTHLVLDACGARAVDFADKRVFRNINAPADLELLER